MLREDRVQHQDPSRDEDKVLDEAKDRLKTAIDAWDENHDRAREDVRFRDGDQWPEQEKKRRQNARRPCLTFNHMESFIDQVVGDQRQNRPAIHVHPVETDITTPRVQNLAGTQDYSTAEIYEGLIRNIEYQSRADIAYDTAFDHAAGHGFGYIRVITQYADDETFNQDIRIKRVPNAFTVYLDPYHEEPDGSDCIFAFVSDWMKRSEFERAYPKAEAVSTLPVGDGEDQELWFEDDKIRVTEYYRRVPKERTIALLSDGSVVELGHEADEVEENRFQIESQGVQVVRERKVKSYIVEWYLLSGHQVLEGPKVWPGKHIPVVPVYGKELNVDGQVFYRGVIRHAKDAQRNYNYWETTATEQVALAPKSPYIGTPTMFSGYEGIWRTANTENHAYLPFNPDPEVATQRPTREAPAPMPTGAMERIESSRQNMMFTTGIHEGGLGARSNETSGRAIMARQKEGDVGSFAFIDNLSRSVAQVGRILIDLLPKIYDTERTVRIRMQDEQEDFVAINQTLPNGERIHDLNVGKYDVVVQTGPSYNTQRQETVDAMIQMVSNNQQLWTVVGDLLVKNMDWPGADEFANRLRKIVPPHLLDLKEGEEPPPPPQPSPADQAEMAKHQATMAKSQADMAKAEADIHGAQADTIGSTAQIMEAQAKIAELQAQMNAIPQMVQQSIEQTLMQMIQQSNDQNIQ